MNEVTLTSGQIQGRLGLCALAVAGAAATSPTTAQAAVVTFSTPIPIPNTFAGVYINLGTGASAITTSGAPGWDIGPWGNSSLLSLFFPSTPAASFGGVASTTTGPYLDLPVGTVIGPASTYALTTSSAAMATFQDTGTGILGVRFFNEATSSINYGYLTISSTGPGGFPATVTGWSFENTGVPITVAGVPEPTVAMSALALGAVGLRRWRRRAA